MDRRGHLTLGDAAHFKEQGVEQVGLLLWAFHLKAFPSTT